MIRNFITLLLTVFALNAFAAVDVNQASRADLETVKGIGPGLSGKIVDARKTAQFKDWGDLVERVGGIGDRNAVKLSQAGLTVGGSSFDGKTAASASASATTSAAAPAKEAKEAKARKAKKSEKADA